MPYFRALRLHETCFLLFTVESPPEKHPFLAGYSVYWGTQDSGGRIHFKFKFDKEKMLDFITN